jgi:single-strand DNA-binding protein
MNKVILLGRLTKDPELRTTNSGISSTKFTIAVNRRFKNEQTGEYDADFITCTAWKQTAEFISRYFTKGQMIVVEGNLRTGSYQDRNHPDVTHYTTEVYVDNAEFAGSKSESSGQGNYTTSGGNTAQRAVQAANNAGVQTQQMEYSSSSSFEEIISDGDVPF